MLSQWRRFPWDNDEGWFQDWTQGLTGVLIVDHRTQQARFKALYASLSGD